MIDAYKLAQYFGNLWDLEQQEVLSKRTDSGVDYYVDCIGLSKENLSIGIREKILEVRMNYKDHPFSSRKEDTIRIPLPVYLDIGEIKASLKNGLLTISIQNKEMKNVEIKIE